METEIANMDKYPSVPAKMILDSDWTYSLPFTENCNDFQIDQN